MDQNELEAGTLDTDHVEVRTLAPADLDWVVAIDQRYSGRSRSEYFKKKLAEAQNDTGIRISLAAIVDKVPAGFLMGRLYYGEFGLPEPAAIIDSLGVSQAMAGKKIGKALMRQLAMNLRGLGVQHVQTQVDWDQGDLIAFFRQSGFLPAPRLCLELDLSQSR
ncbi:MAG: GNAT family N-acetyltransferase [Polyangiaceae bacterium]